MRLGDGLDQNDNKVETSEIIDNKNSSFKLTAMSRNKMTKTSQRFGKHGNCHNRAV